MRLKTDDVEVLAQIFRYAASNKGFVDIEDTETAYLIVVTVQVMIVKPGPEGKEIIDYEFREHRINISKDDEDQGFKAIRAARLELGLV